MLPKHLIALQALLFLAVGCDGTKDADTADTAEPTVWCVNPASYLLDNGEPSGFDVCEDGAFNRVFGASFEPINSSTECGGDEVYLSCVTDADCTDGPHGACVHETGKGEDSCGCEYACATDTDCDPGYACIPAELSGQSRPTCELASCLTPADCASEECGLGSYFTGCGWSTTLLCRDAADDCHGDGECDTGDCAVAYNSDQFTCVAPDCDIGRPLRIDDQSRVADTAAIAGWSNGDPPDADEPADPAQRAILAAHWAKVASLEHASIASFARFSLQLLALGAPAALLLDAQTAAADEVRHAQLAFTLASRFSGFAVGPRPMMLADAMPRLDAWGVIEALIDEACVGETLGAAEAAACAEAACDPDLRAGLFGIAEDEARHAALAWRSLAWLLREHPEHIAAARDRLDRAIAAHTPPQSVELADAGLSAWGLPGAASRAAAHRGALRIVRDVAAQVLVAPERSSAFLGVAASPPR